MEDDSDEEDDGWSQASIGKPGAPSDMRASCMHRVVNGSSGSRGSESEQANRKRQMRS